VVFFETTHGPLITDPERVPTLTRVGGLARVPFL
jgi:hypothetical protein